MLVLSPNQIVSVRFHYVSNVIGVRTLMVDVFNDVESDVFEGANRFPGRDSPHTQYLVRIGMKI